MNRKHFLFTCATITLLLIVAFLLQSLAPAANVAQPRISWTPANIQVILPLGSSTSSQVTFVSDLALPNATLEVVPELASFLKIQPSHLSKIQGGRTQQLLITFSAPTNATLGNYDGTIRARIGARTIPQTLKVTLTLTNPLPGTVTNKGISVTIPPGFRLDKDALALGGPISLNNFNNNFLRGGIIPQGGVEIDVTSIPLPKPPLNDLIAAELEGSTITSSVTTVVGGESATEVFYTDVFGPSLTYSNVAVYVPHLTTVYKIYLSYRSDDPTETQILAAFQQMISTIQFNP
jgi:hypothetical protein